MRRPNRVTGSLAIVFARLLIQYGARNCKKDYSSCGFNINWVKLLLAFGKSWNYQLCPLERNTLMYGEASISRHHITRNQLAQDTTVFCQKLVRGSTTPCLRSKCNSTLRCDANQDFNGIMVFARAECLCSSE